MMNKKAFTIVELLSVIVILGILLSISTVIVATYMNTAKETSYNNLVKSIEGAAELYITDHSGDYPQLETVGSTFDIELNDLVENNYINKSNIIDERKGSSIPLTTKITITVVSEDQINVDFIYE